MTAPAKLLYTLRAAVCLSVLFFGSFLTFCAIRHAAVRRLVVCFDTPAVSGHRERALRRTSLCHFLRRMRCNYIIFIKLTLCAGIGSEIKVVF